jgi:hypothetical protein
MKTQFASNVKKQKRSVLAGMLFLCAVFLVPFVVKAQQLAPVGAEFKGTWYFDHAQVKEKDSKQDYTTQTFLKGEFSKKTYAMGVPVQLTFSGDFPAAILINGGIKRVFAVMDKDKLEFRDAEGWYLQGETVAPTAEDVKISPVVARCSGLRLSDGFMICSYHGGNASGDSTDRLITIYYKRVSTR